MVVSKLIHKAWTLIKPVQPIWIHAHRTHNTTVSVHIRAVVVAPSSSAASCGVPLTVVADTSGRHELVPGGGRRNSGRAHGILGCDLPVQRCILGLPVLVLRRRHSSPKTPSANVFPALLLWLPHQAPVGIIVAARLVQKCDLYVVRACVKHS